MNNGTLPGDWKRATVNPILKGGDRSLVTNYRPVCSTSIVCEQMEHDIASDLREVYNKNNWFYDGYHGFRPGFSCQNQVMTVCQETSDSLGIGERTDAMKVYFSKVFNLVTHGRLLTKTTNSGVDSRVVVWIKEFVLGRTHRVTVGSNYEKNLE